MAGTAWGTARDRRELSEPAALGGDVSILVLVEPSFRPVHPGRRPGGRGVSILVLVEPSFRRLITPPAYRNLGGFQSLFWWNPRFGGAALVRRMVACSPILGPPEMRVQNILKIYDFRFLFRRLPVQPPVAL